MIFRTSLRALPALVLAAALAPGAAAQSFRTYAYTEVDGLPSSEITDLAQAPDGRIWFATRAGIAVYDGVGFRRVPGRPGAPDRAPEHLEVDREARVWTATREARDGIAVLEGSGWRAIPAPRELAGAGPVRDLAADRSGSIVWVAARSAPGVLRWDGSWRAIGASEGLPSDEVYDVVATEGAAWVATHGGLATVDAEGAVGRPLDPSATPSPEVMGLAFERGAGPDGPLWLVGRDWIGTFEGGAFTLRHAAIRIHSFGVAHRDDVRHVAPDGSGGAYFGVPDALLYDDPAAREPRPFGRRDGHVAAGATALLSDRDGNVWIGCLRGATRVPPPRFHNWDTDQGLPEDEVTAIAELPTGELLLGHVHGLSFFDDGEAIPVEEGLEGATEYGRVNDLAVDAEGRAWIAASDRGFARVDRFGSVDRFPVAREAPTVANTVCIDGDGRVLAGDSQGLLALERGELVPAEEEVLGGHALRRLFVEDAGRRLFAATDRAGVFLREDGAWRRCRHPSRDDANNVFAVRADREGRTWVGSKAGLFLLEGDALAEPPGGMGVDEPVYAILETPDGRLWFGTDDGLRVWDGSAMRALGVHDGLVGSEVNRAALIADSRGRVWIGTDRGLSRYRGEFDRGAEPPSVAIASIRANGEALPAGEPIELAHAENDLAFDVDAISFAVDGRVFLQWRLDGFDAEWLEGSGADARRARYTNVPPGEYRLVVRARNRRSEWSEPVASRPIAIAKPFHSTWWFRGLLALAVLASGSVLTALVLARRQSSELERLVRERSAALEDSERRYREMFEKHRAPQLLLDPATTRVIDANPAASAFFGMEARSLRGRPFAEVTGAAAELVRERLAPVEREHYAQFLLESSGAPADGRTLEGHACAYELSGSEILQVTLTDATARLRLEEALQQAKRLEAIGRLAGGIAHDFNNLLTAILGCSEVALEALPEGSPVRAELEDIQRAGARGSSLVAQLLAFSRGQVLAPEVADLNAIVTDTFRLLRRVLGESVAIGTRLDGSAGRVRIDRAQLERVLVNLAINARDAMPGGGGLSIETGRAEPAELPPEAGGRPWALIRVHDEGTGMAAATRARVFEPFFSTKPVGEGSGLGLSTVHGIVHQSGGHIDVESEEGRGTTIRIWLPQVSDAETEHGVLVPRPPHRGAPAGRSGDVARGGAHAPAREVELADDRANVLLVEDDPDVRRLAAEVLRSSGHRVLEASDGEEALRLFASRGRRVELLLTDVVMPHVSGRELAARLTAERPDLRVLYVSGYEGDARLATRGTAPHDFLRKPFTPRQLRRKIERILARAGREAVKDASRGGPVDRHSR